MTREPHLTAASYFSDTLSEALAPALSQGRTDLLSLASHLEDRSQRMENVAVPEALSGYHIEAADPADYDRLLAGSSAGGAA